LHRVDSRSRPGCDVLLELFAILLLDVVDPTLIGSSCGPAAGVVVNQGLPPTASARGMRARRISLGAGIVT